MPDATPAPRTGPIERLDTETRQAAIVQAAVRLCGHHSPGDITTADFAREVGLTQGAIFKHFASKEAIWLAVMDWVAAHLLERLRAAARTPSTPLEALAAMFRTHVAFVAEHPGVPRLVFHDLQQAADSPVKRRLGALLAEYRALLLGQIEAAIERKDLTNPPPAPAAAMLFIGIVQGLAMQSLLSPQALDLRAEGERLLPLFLRSIGAPT